MNELDELKALRRMAELEDKAGSKQSLTKQEAIDPTEGNNFFQNAAIGLGKNLTDKSRSFQQLIGGMGLGGAGMDESGTPTSPESKQFYDSAKERQKTLQAEIDESKRLDAPLMKTGGGIVGNLLPDVATAMIPGSGTIKGATAIGAGLGAMQPVASDESRLGNTAESAAWSGGATAGLNAIGKLASPLVGTVKSTLSPYKQRLIDAVEEMGGKVTPGQKTGKAWMQKLESAFERDPVTSKWIDKGRAANQGILNKEATSGIGEKSDHVPDDLIGRAYNRVGDMFASIKDETISLSDDFSKSVSKAADNFNRTWSGKGDSSARSLLRSAESAIKKGSLSGDEYNLVRSDLSGLIRSAGTPSNTKQLAHELVDALDDAAVKGISGYKSETVSQARNDYKKLIGIEKSLNGENVSGAKLAGHLTKNDKAGYGRGEDKSKLYEMLRFQRNFPDAVGNSGTPTGMSLNNNITQALSGAAIGGGYGLYSGDPSAVLYGMAAPMAAKKGTEHLYRALGKYATMKPVKQLTPDMIALINALKAGSAQGISSYNMNKD